MSWLTGTTPPALPSRSWRATAARLADEHRVWTGSSLTVLSGQAVAEHLAAAREWLAGGGWDASERPLVVALIKTSPGGDADLDSQLVARRLLGMILQARANAPMPGDVSAWEARPGRTWVEVRELLADGIAIAREHGPTGGGR